MSDEEREYLNEMIRNLNNRLVDALRERDEARRDAERWRDDALRLMNERNAAQKERDELVGITKRLVIERDEARRAYCISAWRRLPDEQATTITPVMIAQQQGWDWRSWAPFKEEA